MKDRAELLPAIERETGANPDAAVIWLHGLGADGHDFEPVVDELRLPLAVRFVLPHAPVRPVTLNFGMAMPSWCDIHGLDFDAEEDQAGIEESSQAVERLIARERERGIATKRIVLAGFSQGGAIALHAGLNHADKLAGIIALSTWLPRCGRTLAENRPGHLAPPVFMAHGRADPTVRYAIGEYCRDRLRELNYDVAWHDYAMGHAVCPEEIRDIRQWLLDRLG